MQYDPVVGTSSNDRPTSGTSFLPIYSTIPTKLDNFTNLIHFNIFSFSHGLLVVTENFGMTAKCQRLSTLFYFFSLWAILQIPSKDSKGEEHNDTGKLHGNK